MQTKYRQHLQNRHKNQQTIMTKNKKYNKNTRKAKHSGQSPHLADLPLVGAKTSLNQGAVTPSWALCKLVVLWLFRTPPPPKKKSFVNWVSSCFFPRTGDEDWETSRFSILANIQPSVALPFLGVYQAWTYSI